MEAGRLAGNARAVILVTTARPEGRGYSRAKPRPSGRAVSLGYLYQHLADFDPLALRYIDYRYGALDATAQVVEHLHRLDHQQDIAAARRIPDCAAHLRHDTRQRRT